MFALKNKGEDYNNNMVVLGMSMLCTIYSLFKRFGIVQLLSSAGLGRLGTLKKALTGGDVKEVI